MTRARDIASEDSNYNGFTNTIASRASSTSTPTGWSEYTTARGRMIVGLQSGGADGGTVGTAFTTQQDKTHVHSGPSHSHQIQKVNWGGNVQLIPSDFYGTSGTFTSSKYIAYTSTATGGLGIPLTNTSGTGNTGQAPTSDVLAYIQLMTIKKD